MARSAARRADRPARAPMPPTWGLPPTAAPRRLPPAARRCCGAMATRAVSTNITRPSLTNHGTISKSAPSGSTFARCAHKPINLAIQSSPTAATPHAPEFHSRGARSSTYRPTAYAQPNGPYRGFTCTPCPGLQRSSVETQSSTPILSAAVAHAGVGVRRATLSAALGGLLHSPCSGATLPPRLQEPSPPSGGDEFGIAAGV
mmetsp:Transcript_48158/g.110655  ORF Transcript_48158/g.110655 Transcript_48158/m.110655 type:complete len:202 (+) Transcript_48158:736-1341(+)